jgi:hypothetical protein
MQQVVDLARKDLNDADKVAYTDPDLLEHANAGIREAYQIRPDLRLGNYATPIANKAIGEDFPLSDDYKRAVADFVIGRASAVDADHVDSGRVPAYIKSFHDTLLGV